MQQVSSTMRRGRDRYFHWCPACEEMHPLPDSWKFNGNVDRPTFAPSFKHTLVRWSGGIDAHGIGQGERQQVICHYTITDGLIQFHLDSWHKRTDIVAMPPLPAVAADFTIETQD